MKAVVVLLFGVFAVSAGGQTYRVGALWSGSQKDGIGNGTAFVQELKALGYEEGRNLIIDSLHAEWDSERFVELAQTMVRRNPNLIYAPTRAAASSLRKVSSGGM